MAITDLTGTVWAIPAVAPLTDEQMHKVFSFPSQVTFSGLNANFYLYYNGSLYKSSVNELKYFKITSTKFVLASDTSSSPSRLVELYNNTDYSPSYWGSHVKVTGFDSRIGGANGSSVYEVIEITGGTGATDPILIYWLTLNAIDITPKVTVDLSTLSGWSDVADGTHTLTIKAKASRYRDSDPSTGVSFVKGGTGFSGTVTNTGYIPTDIYVDSMYGEGDPDYSITSDEMATFSCNYFYMVDQWFEEYSVTTATNCTYEEVSDDPYFGYKVTPTADNWVFTAEFID